MSVLEKPLKNNVFLCGKQLNEGQTNREIIKEYFEKHHNNEYDIVFAEEFVKSANDGRNLLDIENIIGTYADSILIILESPSTFAELGAFANNPDLVKKILVINEKQFETSQSFINNGPVATIKRESKYKNVIYFRNSSSILETVESIVDALNIDDRKNFKHVFYIEEHAFLQNYTKTERNFIILVFDLLNLLAPVKESEIVFYLQELTPKSRRGIIDAIGILNALGYIERKDDYLEPKKQRADGLIFDDHERCKTRAKILQCYIKYDKERVRHHAKRNSF